MSLRRLAPTVAPQVEGEPVVQVGPLLGGARHGGLDRVVHGQIAGYQPAEQIYDIFGRQAGAAGAEALSYSCSGLYEALLTQADGDFDPVTRTCSSLSVAYRFAGIPVFVVR